MPPIESESATRRRFLRTLIGLTVSSQALPKRAEAVSFCGSRSAQGVRQCKVGILSPLTAQAAAWQEESEWCWAACISMVFNYYGYHVPQARIVEETFGRLINRPANPEQILGQLNRVWEDERGKPFLAEGGPLPVSTRSVALHLARDKPLIIGTIGHAMVMTEYRWAEDLFGQHHPVAAIARDPALGGKERILTLPETRLADFLAFVHVNGEQR